MLPEQLKTMATAAALEGFAPAAVTGGKFDRGELSLDIAPADIVVVCRHLKDNLGFVRLSAVTAVDWYPTQPRFAIVYLLHSLDRNERVRLECRVGTREGDAEIESVTGVWRSANWCEREIFDLFGVRFLNHPDLRRIMMPEDWQGHPLRKDYPILGTR